MKAEFWHERWEKGEIGFHQGDFNRHMQDFLGRLGVRPGAHIFVPLCGKSLDMLWLAGEGYRVSGIELSPLAAEGFFTENGLDYAVEKQAGTVIYRGENVEIFCADFFSLEQSALARIDAVYDRAALIALPPEMRPAYASRLSRWVDAGVRCLLVTLEYPGEQMRGPPFSVDAEEVKTLFQANWRLEQIHVEDCLVREPRFRKKGLTRLDERVFILQRRAA
ncbi:MAG: thiopurine S-methyltransferase [Xanthomonadales bacterium]|nr:thiopurine S-methyltransferase [Gammaproteobacteria bacterium]MBT8053584.1 thiopurine S-methyltransferase [Gammaproteobacteria bacterium]NND57935.1 thiopurine S-methyltransferase [Xanthomonadales bacterium]NNK50899.1 thiopurine S-methyltransferase [Xanthomonadales bacterium]